MLERDRERVLILGPEEATRVLAGRVALADLRGVRATSPEEALYQLASAPAPIQVAMLAEGHGLPDVADALRRLSAGASRGRLVWIAVGRRPGPEAAAELRRAGVRFGLFDAFGDEELRFVLSEARHTASGGAHRGDDRVPANLRARIATPAGHKVAVVHNLSTTGAYLVTPRPTLRGGRVRVQFELPDGEPLDVAAEVIWHNVPGNLRRPNAPIGMGVRFLELPPGAEKSLSRWVDARARSYRL